MSRFSRYTKEARLVLTYAREEAQRLRHRLVGTEHLLLGILRLNDPLVEGVFMSLQVTTSSVLHALDFVMGRGNRAILSEPVLNVAARITLARAEEEANTARAELINVEHLLLGILGERDGVAMGVLESLGVMPDIARQHIIRLMSSGRESLLLSAQYQAHYNTTPMLNQVSRDLTMAALMGTLDPMIGREAELERTMQILSRRTKNNPVLIGPAGVGKTAIAEGLALRIIQGQVSDELRKCRVVALDVGLLTIGTKFRGDFEERLRRIMQEIISTPGLIIVIDELHALVRTGVAEGSLDAANLFKPMLARGEFQCIGATTLDEYRRTVEADPALERRFQPVLVMETTTGETLEIVRGLRSRYEDFHQVTISDAAIEAAVHMSSRYIQGRFQPDKSLDLIDEAASRVCVQQSVVPDAVQQLRTEVIMVQREKESAIAIRDFPQAAKLFRRERQLRKGMWQEERNWQVKHERPIVGEQEIAEVVSRWTGIPVVQITDDEIQHLLNLEAALHQRVIGQQEAIQAVAKAVRRSRTNIRDCRRPIGSFIFAGPTGVGKTELARALATTLFNDENALLTLDMSEFMESHHTSRLIGAPPGYVGYDQGGQLTEAIRRRPYSIVLFDEIEKAHPKVFDLLLQILEDGCLTDAHGKVVDFRHTIIVITSNVGMLHRSEDTMMFVPEQHNKEQRRISNYKRMRERVLTALKDLFRPELLNRIDDVIVFHMLEQEHLRDIVDIMISQTRQRMAAQSIELRVADAARLLLVEHGYNPTYGARMLRRTVQCMLDDLLAEIILRGEVAVGSCVEVDVVDGTLNVRVMEPAENASNVVSDPGSLHEVA